VDEYKPLAAGSYTTGDLIPLVPGERGVFRALRGTTADNPPCWNPSAFDGIEAGNNTRPVLGSS
jgi:hypothetical protein